MPSLFSGPKLPDQPKIVQPPTPDEAVTGVTPDARKRLAAAFSQRSSALSVGTTSGLTPVKSLLGQ